MKRIQTSPNPARRPDDRFRSRGVEPPSWQLKGISHHYAVSAAPSTLASIAAPMRCSS